jgi:hypothetical protein
MQLLPAHIGAQEWRSKVEYLCNLATLQSGEIAEFVTFVNTSIKDNHDLLFQMLTQTNYLNFL